MRIRCPHCHHALEIVADSTGESVKCPSCGSNLPGLEETIEPRRREAVKSIGHFELLERVGRGHFGDVFRAHDAKLDRTVAVKIPRLDRVNDSTLDLFMHEARAAAQLRHPHIVRVYEVNEQDELVYIVSDFIRGVTLADRIEARRYEPKAAAALLATVAEALHYAHQAGVVHRDLKPSNIMLDDAGEPHLMDFGLAKADSSEISITVSGDILGTPAYMSPEQARGDSHHADRRSDVYSLGVVLYVMISGEHPFAAETGTLLRRVASDEPAPSRRISEKLPRDLATICLKAMEKDPARRYATAQELADDLRRYLRGDPIRARRAGMIERSWRWMRRNPVAAVSSAAMLMLSVLLVVAVAWIANSEASHKRSDKLPEPAPVPELPPSLAARRTIIATEPAGAKVVFIPLDETTGRPIPEKKTPAEPVTGMSHVTADLVPSDYLVVAYFDNDRFHEVIRRVPKPGREATGTTRHNISLLNERGEVQMTKIEIPDASVIKDMARFDGHPKFMVGFTEAPTATNAPMHQCRVPAFYLDTTEFTVGACRELSTNLIHKKLAAQNPPDDYPLVFVTYDHALVLAERSGKRLPDEYEYEFAATGGGKLTFPWGDDPAPIKKLEIGPVKQAGFELHGINPLVYGLYSNVAEWTSSWPALYPGSRGIGMVEGEGISLERAIRGGPLSFVEDPTNTSGLSAGPRSRAWSTRLVERPGLGFRCARSAKPRLEPADFAGPQ